LPVYNFIKVVFDDNPEARLRFGVRWQSLERRHKFITIHIYKTSGAQVIVNNRGTLWYCGKIFSAAIAFLRLDIYRKQK